MSYCVDISLPSSWPYEVVVDLRLRGLLLKFGRIMDVWIALCSSERGAPRSIGVGGGFYNHLGCLPASVAIPPDQGPQCVVRGFGMASNFNPKRVSVCYAFR